jgi:hypothetical protein
MLSTRYPSLWQSVVRGGIFTEGENLLSGRAQRFISAGNRSLERSKGIDLARGLVSSETTPRSFLELPQKLSIKLLIQIPVVLRFEI